MERRKYIGRGNDYIKTFSSEIIEVDEEDIKGYASFMKVEEVHRPFMAGEVCLYNNGFSEIGFLPKDAHWGLYALYDDSGEIIEWYVDITRKNAIDEEGRPYCDDLYLDAALLPDGQILVFDEDELKDALDHEKITRKEYDMAYNVLSELKEKKILTVAFMEDLCARLRRLFG